MPARSRSLARVALAFTFFAAPGHTAPRAAASESFDVYAVGIRIAELTIADAGGSRSYTIRKKDVASNQWRAAVTAGERDAARDTAFRLSTSINNAAAWMSSLRPIHWGSQHAVGWPDANTIYVPHTSLHENV